MIEQTKSYKEHELKRAGIQLFCYAAIVLQFVMSIGGIPGNFLMFVSYRGFFDFSFEAIFESLAFLALFRGVSMVFLLLRDKFKHKLGKITDQSPPLDNKKTKKVKKVEKSTQENVMGLLYFLIFILILKLGVYSIGGVTMYLGYLPEIILTIFTTLIVLFVLFIIVIKKDFLIGLIFALGMLGGIVPYIAPGITIPEVLVLFLILSILDKLFTLYCIATYVLDGIPGFCGMFDGAFVDNYFRLNWLFVLEACAFVSSLRIISVALLGYARRNGYTENHVTKNGIKKGAIKSLFEYGAVFFVMSLSKFGISLVFEMKIYVGIFLLMFLSYLLLIVIVDILHGVITKKSYVLTAGNLCGVMPTLVMYISPSISFNEAFAVLLAHNAIAKIAEYTENLYNKVNLAH